MAMLRGPDALARLIDTLAAELPVDRARVYLLGHSLGRRDDGCQRFGHGNLQTMRTLCRERDKLHGNVPECAGVMPISRPGCSVTR